MFAVIETGGKQYKVAKDDVIRIEKVSGEAGDKVTLDRVLLLGDEKSTKIGTPLINGVSVSAEIVEQTRGDKVIVFKKKRRKKYRRTQGHRQDLTVLKILSIGEGKAAAKKAAPKATAEESGKATTKKAKKSEGKATEKKAAAKTKSDADAKPAKKATSAKKAAPKAKAKQTKKAAAKSPAKK